MSGPSAAIERLRSEMPGAIRGEHHHVGDATVLVDAGALRDALAFLRGTPELDFDMLIDVTAVDHHGRRDRPPGAARFEVVYHLYSVSKNHRLRVKVEVAEDAPEVASVVSIWPAANWLEREVFDLYGIRFRDHPDLRRILLYPEFEGHPLRKDYPKTKRQPLVGPVN